MHCMVQSYVARPSIIGIACNTLAPLGNVSSLMSVLLWNKMLFRHAMYYKCK